MSENLNKRKFEQDSSITSVSPQLDNMCDENEGFLQNLFDVVFYDGEKILENLSKKIYPELKYKLINYGIKYDIYAKEPEDFELSSEGYRSKNDYDIEYLKHSDDSLIIDGNKLIICAGYKNDIDDKIIFLILNYQIDVLIIRHSYWNKPIDNLPDRILSIRIYSEYFDQPIDNLPANLKILCIKSVYINEDDDKYDNIAGRFDQPIDHLPSNLEELVICTTIFDEPVDNLPSKLKRLYIGAYLGYFNQYVDNLPPNLEILCISSTYFEQELNNLPDSLEILYIENYIDNLPDILENLPQKLKTLYYAMSHAEDAEDVNYTVNNLPNNIKALYLGVLNNTIDNLPDSVEKLYINGSSKSFESWNFNTVINKLPKNLKTLYIDRKNIKYVGGYTFGSYIQDTIIQDIDIEVEDSDSDEELVLFTCDYEQMMNVYSKNIHKDEILNWKEIGYNFTSGI